MAVLGQLWVLYGCILAEGWGLEFLLGPLRLYVEIPNRFWVNFGQFMAGFGWFWHAKFGPLLARGLKPKPAKRPRHNLAQNSAKNILLSGICDSHCYAVIPKHSHLLQIESKLSRLCKTCRICIVKSDLFSSLTQLLRHLQNVLSTPL